MYSLPCFNSCQRCIRYSTILQFQMKLLKRAHKERFHLLFNLEEMILFIYLILSSCGAISEQNVKLSLYNSLPAQYMFIIRTVSSQLLLCRGTIVSFPGQSWVVNKLYSAYCSAHQLPSKLAQQSRQQTLRAYRPNINCVIRLS